MPLFGPPNIEKLKARCDVAGLIKALGYEKDFRIRQGAANALGEIGDARAVEPLLTAILDSNWFVRLGAIKALEAIGDIRVVEPLVPLLNHWDESVREFATGALGKFGDPR
jgi:HEAT repeat protein